VDMLFTSACGKAYVAEKRCYATVFCQGSMRPMAKVCSSA
jgi:hypothetical protein